MKQHHTLWMILVLWVMTLAARADVIVSTNGERFVGSIVEEREDVVVFDSDSAGRLTLPRERIQEIQRSGPRPQPPSPISSATNANWHPPTVGTDGFDWLQLDTDEWLKGRLRYAQKRNIRFESDKLEELTMEWKDVKRLYTGQPMYVKFDDRERVYGNIVLSNEMVFVDAPEPVSLSRSQLTGITPGDERELSFWSGKLSLGLNLQSGNQDQITFNVQGELARRTPATEFVLGYLANFSELNGAQSANNTRLDSSFDILLSRNFFIRPAVVEFYRDPLLNIKYRGTAGVGVGYYIFNEDRLRWLVAGGPGYQYTKFETVEAGRPDASSTPALVFDTNFRADITRRIKLLQSYGVFVTKKEAGLYTHHAVTTFEYEIKHHLNLNISLVWDFLLNPQPDASGQVPSQTDLYLIVGLGAKF